MFCVFAATTYFTGETIDYRIIYRGYTAYASGDVNLFHKYGLQYKIKYWFGSVWHNIKGERGNYYEYSLAEAKFSLIETFHLDNLDIMPEIVLYDPHPKWREKNSYYDKNRPDIRVIY